jgi:hypothetical protein
MNMQNEVNVQVDFVNGEKGTYVCTKRPYFTYENNTAMLHLTDGTTVVIPLAQVLMISY